MVECLHYASVTVTGLRIESNLNISVRPRGWGRHASGAAALRSMEHWTAKNVDAANRANAHRNGMTWARYLLSRAH
jgi:hypothetical protein